MLDVNGWQALFDFRSGEPVEGIDQPYMAMPKKICREHPYPGDTNPQTVQWVTDTALDVCREYDPRLMILSYASGSIMRVNTKMSDEEQHALSRRVIAEAFRFAETADYEPVIISNCGLKHFDKILHIDGIDGYLTYATDKYMAGIFYPSERDYETVKQLPGVTPETKESFIARYGIKDSYALERTPDIILYADEDTALTNVGERGTIYHMIPEKKKTCLCYTRLPGLPDSIFDFREYIDGLLAQGKKIAVIIAEAVDDSDMPDGSREMCKYKNGIYYGENVSFYYALLNGREFFEEGMPYIYHNQFLKKTSKNRYPFSYIKTEYYQDPIGLDRDFRTAAVGNRSGVLHSAAMCDYSFECHCRGLAESGLLVFVNRK